MKLVKSLLLGSAAGLAAVAGAQAADLPAKQVAAVEYVRVCSAYGSGFFYIPGTETCLRVGGRVRADYIYTEPFNRLDNSLVFRARGRIQLDARNQTAYGTLRTFVRMEMTQTGADRLTGGGSTSPNIAQAFIQWGGLTAGKVTSFFSNPDLPTAHMGSLRFDDSPDIPLLAYTFSFGNGFSATIAAEEGLARRTTDVVFGAPFDRPFASINYAGQRMPDFVGNVRYAGTWGSAQLSGAVHQLRDAIVPFARDGAGFPIPLTGRDFADTEYGWAVGASVGVNLPMIAAGDAAWLSAAYSQGASSYSGFGNLNAGTFGADDITVGGVTDAVVVGDDLKRVRIWNIAGGFTHYWVPTFRSSVFGSYARVDYPGGATVGLGGGFVRGFLDFNEWRVGANTFWSPVSGLNIGVEVLYAQADLRGGLRFVTNAAPLRTESDVGRIEGRLRIQRDF